METRNTSRRIDKSADRSQVGDLALRYLSAERDYHLDLLQLLRQMSGAGLTPAMETQVDQLRVRRETVSTLRDDVLSAYQRQTGRADANSLSEIILACGTDAQQELGSLTQEVRALVIQTRMATERLSRRLTLMHDCLEELLTGRTPSKSTSYDRAGRLRSRPSSRSLFTQRG